MRLTRYIARQMLQRSLVSCAILLLIYTAIDMVETSALPGAPPSLPGTYLLKLPTVLGHVLPVALAIGLQATVASLRGTGQWDGVGAVGLSPWRLIVGLLAVPLAALLLCGINAAWVAPAGQRAFGAAFQQDTDPASSALWFRDANSLIRATRDGRLLVTRDRTGRPVQWARSTATPAGGETLTEQWQARAGWSDDVETGPASWHPLPTVLGHTAADPVWGQVGATLDAGALWRAIETLDQFGHDAKALQAEVALRVALVAACLILPLLCVGLALQTSTAQASVLIGYGLLGTLAYWLVLTAGWNGVRSGILSWPVLIAGMPAIGLVAGLVLLIPALSPSAARLFGRSVVGNQGRQVGRKPK